MRNASDAEDAAQECNLRALRHFDNYRGPAMKPFLFDDGGFKRRRSSPLRCGRVQGIQASRKSCTRSQ
jgi:hypothetical protein